MVISGIDGVGKSALIVRFAEGVVADLPLLWFDFDRADLAPDDAVSLVAALAEQADLQLDVFKPAPLDSVEGTDLTAFSTPSAAPSAKPRRAPCCSGR